MFVRAWRFRAREGREDEFESAYGPEGTWAVLFRRSAGYLGTELLRSAADPSAYLTVDRWTSAEAWRDFEARWRDEYARLDRACEALTSDEEDLGDHTVVRAGDPEGAARVEPDRR